MHYFETSIKEAVKGGILEGKWNQRDGVYVIMDFAPSGRIAFPSDYRITFCIDGSITGEDNEVLIPFGDWYNLEEFEECAYLVGADIEEHF